MKQPLLTYTNFSLARARELRKESTQYEHRLWGYLRNNHLGVKFRRQAPVGRYIVDFLAVRAKLVVELDGVQHKTVEGKTSDNVRDNFLARQGLKVLRFDNQAVVESIESVVDEIQKAVNARLK